MINAETSVGACGSDLWQKIRDRWRARRAERETNTHQIATWRDEGRPGEGGHELGAEGICQGRQQEYGGEATQRRPQDALRALSASEGSQIRSLHVLDDQARGARVQETERATARLLGTSGDQGKGTRPRTSRDSGVHGPVASAVGERGSTVGASNAAGVANLKQTWHDMEPKGAFDLVPHCKLAKLYDPALSRLELVISVAQHRERTRGALGQTGANRLLGQAPSGALERALSAAIEHN